MVIKPDYLKVTPLVSTLANIIKTASYNRLPTTLHNLY